MNFTCLYKVTTNCNIVSPHEYATILMPLFVCDIALHMNTINKTLRKSHLFLGNFPLLCESMLPFGAAMCVLSSETETKLGSLDGARVNVGPVGFVSLGIGGVTIVGTELVSAVRTVFFIFTKLNFAHIEISDLR